jgi:hypothetical protein
MRGLRIAVYGSLVTMAIGTFMYTRIARSASRALGADSPQAAMEVANLRNHLMAYALAER